MGDDTEKDEYTESESQVVDEAYLQEPSYEEKRVKTTATEEEMEQPWWLDTTNNRVQLIGKVLAWIVVISLLFIGFTVFTAGDGQFLPGSGESPSGGVDNLNVVDNTSVVNYERVEGSDVIVSPRDDLEYDDLNIENETRIRLADAMVPASTAENVDPSRFGMEDTQENRACLAGVGQESASFIDSEMSDSDVVLFREGETFGNNASYNGPERYYVLVSDRSLGLQLIERGYATVPVWEFEKRSEWLSVVRGANEEGVGVWQCGDATLPSE